MKKHFAEYYNSITFIFPIRLDSIERLENVILTTNKLLENINTKIVVIESKY